jgi:hypothetical protein
MPPTECIQDAPSHPRKQVAGLKGEFGDTELAVNHVFSWFTEESQSPFLHLTCIQVATRKPTKCTCLHVVLDSKENPTTNNARTLKEVSAYVVFFARLKREEIIWEVMGWKKYADIIEKSSWTKKVTVSP